MTQKKKKAKKFDTQQNIKSNIRNSIHINIGEKVVKKVKKDKAKVKAKAQTRTAPIPMSSFSRPQFAPIPINHSENVMSGLSNKIAMLDSRIASHLRNPQNVNLLNVPSRSKVERVSTADAYTEYNVEEPPIMTEEPPITTEEPPITTEEPPITTEEPNENDEEPPPLNEPPHPQHSSNATIHPREDIHNFNIHTEERRAREAEKLAENESVLSIKTNKNEQHSDGIPRATRDTEGTSFMPTAKVAKKQKETEETTAYAIASSRNKLGRPPKKSENVASTNPIAPRTADIHNFFQTINTPKFSIPLQPKRKQENRSLLSDLSPTIYEEPTIEEVDKEPTETPNQPTETPKKRGRKKGSKNKPKI